MAKQEATLLLRIKEAGSDILDRLVITLGDVAAAIGWVMEVVTESINAYKEQERAVNQLNQSMINAGTYTAELQNKYLEQAAALQKVTLFTDDQINSAQALLQAQIGNRAVSDELLKATLDLAQAKGMDLASASSLVGKAIAGEANILSRYGIYLDETTAKTDKMAAVTEALESKFGGQAEAARKGTGGIDGFKISAGELTEAIGSRLAPAVAALAEKFIPLIDKLTGYVDAGNLAKKSVQQLSEDIIKVNAELSKLFAERETTQVVGALARINTQIDVQISKLAELDTALQEQIQREADARENAYKNDEARRNQEAEAKKQKILEDMEYGIAQRQVEADLKLAQDMNNQMAVENAKLAHLQNMYKHEDDFEKKKEILKNISNQKKAIAEQKSKEFEAEVQKQRLAGYSTFFGGLASLTQSSNRQLHDIGRAAAIAQTTIDAYRAIQNALATVPYPANIAAAAGIGVQAFMNVSKISGIQLAEGGVVMPRSGGVQATIAEAGQPEVVIPLDRAQEFGLGGGGGGTIIMQGPIFLGDERSAHEFAVEVDRALLKLRQNGESVSFDAVT